VCQTTVWNVLGVSGLHTCATQLQYEINYRISAALQLCEFHKRPKYTPDRGLNALRQIDFRVAAGADEY